MTFEGASAIPQVAALALGVLQQNGGVKPGQKILMNGAGGGVGMFVVQLGKHFGAEVTGVYSTEKLDLMRSIGADHVTDYTKEDFAKNGERYDLIIDVANHRSVFRYKRSLNPGGAYGAIGGSQVRFFSDDVHRPTNFAIREQEDWHLGRESERRHGLGMRAFRSWQGQANHRSNVLTSRNCRGVPLLHGRPRKGKNHHHHVRARGLPFAEMTSRPLWRDLRWCGDEW